MDTMQSPPSTDAVRERWNERYRAGEHTMTDPDPLLFHLYEEFIAPLFPEGGRGLDLAGGAGRHALWLAKQKLGLAKQNLWLAKQNLGLAIQKPGLAKQKPGLANQGWQMTVADLSDEATSMARRNAQAAGVELHTLSEPGIDTLMRASASPEQQYDLIMVFQFLDRSLFPAMRTAIRPGGLILYKSHTVDHLEIGDGKGPKDADRLLERQELLRVFAGARVLYYNETVVRRGTQCILAQMP